uniref:Reverse transcriptase domain-containing protein n=1 Tax=Tanacetum cinerariifolium TaxID=118510 RepID=A0A699ID97_TANCI|nr:reverse transcriptase domain-containing protein [Tanacetum cinerariifolium]
MASEGRPVVFMDNNTGEKSQKGRPWEGLGRKNRERRDRYNPNKEPTSGILQNLNKTSREILASEKVVKTFKKPPNMISKARDTSKYCEFHQDYGHDTNICRELKNQIEEVVKSGKLAHLIKGSRKGKAKQKFRDDSFHNALCRLIPVGSRTQGYHVRISRRKEVAKDKSETQPEEVFFRDGRRPILGARGAKPQREIGALNRFLSKSAEKSLPFFKTLKGCLEKKDFPWIKEADKDFEEMKKYIEKLPTLVAPKAGENLIVYLAASKECISVVLMAEREKDQRPIYFVSKVL